MATDIALDFVTQPDIDAMKAAGVTRCVPYVGPRSWGWPKTTTKPQWDALIAAGFEVAPNFETNTHQMEGGFAAGARDGANVQIALAELGLPDTAPCYFSDDEAVAPQSFHLRAEYMRGVASVCAHERGYYGEGDLIEYLAGQGLIVRGWLSESTSYPGSAAPTTHTVLWQHYGRHVAGLAGSYDVNDVLAADWGQHPRPQGAPVPAPYPQGSAPVTTIAIPVKGHYGGLIGTARPIPGAPGALGTGLVLLENGARLGGDKPAGANHTWRHPDVPANAALIDIFDLRPLEQAIGAIYDLGSHNVKPYRAAILQG